MVVEVVLDTDGGLDDVESLLYLLAAPEAKVQAITLVAGNATIPMVSENVRRSCSFVGRNDVPIYEGSGFNLQGQEAKSDGYFGKNGLADIELPESAIRVVPGCSAAQALVDLTRERPGGVKVVCCGPLTNLALACMQEPRFPANCGSVVVMGGDRNDKTYSNTSEFAEFNFLCDPLAVQATSAMFEGPEVQPITLVDWNLCWHNLLPLGLFDELFGAHGERRTSNKFVELYSKIRDFSNPIVARSLWKEGFVTADLIAAVIAVRPDVVIESHRARLTSIDLVGERAGHSVFAPDAVGNWLMVDRINMTLLQSLFVGALSTPA